MKTETQLDTARDQLQQAMIQAAMPAETDSTVSNEESQKKASKPWNPRHGPRPPGASPVNGVVPPKTGRPLGVKNKLTNIRDAVLEAFETVGGAQYLVKLANGTQSDRAAFTGLVAKVLPTQIQANVDGGIRLELSWLGGRAIGATQAQVEAPKTQVLDLQQDSDGRYQIKDPSSSAAGGGATDAQTPGGGTQAAQDGQQGA